MRNIQATEWCRNFIRAQVKAGDLCVDATAGNGHDTELLCRLAGEKGRVLAFDIQEEALGRTEQRLRKAGLGANVRLIHDSHASMEKYAEAGSVSCIVFNFGYLPGGDHRLGTRPESSAAAVRAGLRLLRPGGILSLCIYSGGDTGYAERDALLSLLRELDEREYLVICCEYFNRRKDPPLPALVVKLQPHPCTQASTLL